jgi:hypothetical protein
MQCIFRIQFCLLVEHPYRFFETFFSWHTDTLSTRIVKSIVRNLTKCNQNFLEEIIYILSSWDISSGIECQHEFFNFYFFFYYFWPPAQFNLNLHTSSSSILKKRYNQILTDFSPLSPGICSIKYKKKAPVVILYFFPFFSNYNFCFYFYQL